MMRKVLIFKNVLFSSLVFGSISGFALEPIPSVSLSEALMTASRNNPELKKAELSSDSSEWGKLESLSEHLPHLGVRGTHFLGAKYSKLGVLFGGNAVEFPSAFPQSEFEIEASILLFDGLGSLNHYRASVQESEASRLELNHLRFRLEEAVRIKFYQTLAARELAKVADQNIETLEQHLKLAQASEHAGFSTNVDVLRIESQLEEARAEKILAVDNAEIARQSLLEAIGVEKEDRPLDGSLPFPDAQKLPVNLTFDVSERGDVQAITRREQAMDRMSAAAGAFWFPKISLFGIEQFYKYGGGFDPAILPNSTFQSAHSFGLRLSWNLFDGGASIARRERARNAAGIAAENSRKSLITSPHEFDAWKRKYIYNSALFLARKRSVEKSAESVRLATLGVRAGTKTHSETLDAELELFRARAGVIRAQVDASEAWANLELAVGHKL